MVLFLTDPPRMGEDREEIAERILNLTLEILYLLSGEDYTIVKKASGVSGGWSRSRGPIKEPPIHFMTCDKNCEKKILELTNKMIELLTGEGEEVMSVKIESVSGEETYVTDDQLCKEEEELPVELRPDGPGDSSSPERWPLYPQECSGEDGGVSPDHEDEELIAIKVEPSASEDETSVTDDQLCKAEDISDDCARSPGGHVVLFPDSDINQDINGQDHPDPKISPVLHSRDSWEIAPCPECRKDVTTNLFPEERTPSDAQSYYRSQCEKCSIRKSTVSEHERDPSGEKLFSCAECGKYFSRKHHLEIHQRIHTGEKPFACLQCGKRFSRKHHLETHLRIHTGEKPFTCLECGRRFAQKSVLHEHAKVHTGERPFSCSECGKKFAQKSVLVEHRRTHTGEKPFLCLECGKRFNRKATLVEHHRIHVLGKPFSCLECGKKFAHKSILVSHQRIHTREKPFSCSECGNCFARKSILVEHQRIHTGEKPYSCLHCGSGFSHKSSFNRHQKIHKGGSCSRVRRVESLVT